jgi:hypothetical protein
MSALTRHFAYLGVICGIGCSAADPGVEGLVRGDFTDGGIRPSGDAAPRSDGSMTGRDGAEGMDGTTVMDAGVNAFTGAGAYGSQKPATSAKQFHMNNGVMTVPGKSTNCLDCHNGGAKSFLFAGTVFVDKAGTMPAVDYEIRVRSKDGSTVGLAHSDDDGNFWFVGNNLNVAANCGARNATNTALMNGDITSGGCNDSACHGGNKGPIHVP